MCVAVIGGMDRLKRDYMNAASKMGIKLKVFTGKENSIAPKIGKADAVVIFTNQVGHTKRSRAASYAKSKNIPVILSHSCGVSSLRRHLGDTLTNSKNNQEATR